MLTNKYLYILYFLVIVWKILMSDQVICKLYSLISFKSHNLLIYIYHLVIRMSNDLCAVSARSGLIQLQQQAIRYMPFNTSCWDVNVGVVDRRKFWQSTKCIPQMPRTLNPMSRCFFPSFLFISLSALRLLAGISHGWNHRKNMPVSSDIMGSNV